MVALSGRTTNKEEVIYLVRWFCYGLFYNSSTGQRIFIDASGAVINNSTLGIHAPRTGGTMPELYNFIRTEYPYDCTMHLDKPAQWNNFQSFDWKVAVQSGFTTNLGVSRYKGDAISYAIKISAMLTAPKQDIIHLGVFINDELVIEAQELYMNADEYFTILKIEAKTLYNNDKIELKIMSESGKQALEIIAVQLEII